MISPMCFGGQATNTMLSVSSQDSNTTWSLWRSNGKYRHNLKLSIENFPCMWYTHLHATNSSSCFSGLVSFGSPRKRFQASLSRSPGRVSDSSPVTWYVAGLFHRLSELKIRQVDGCWGGEKTSKEILHHQHQHQPQHRHRHQHRHQPSAPDHFLSRS